MSWYKTGTVTVTNGSPTVVGVSSLWVDAGVLNPGDIALLPDGKLYEVLSFQSNTGLTLASNYLGSTLSGQAYAILPIGLLPSALAQAVKTTLASANTALTSAVRFDINSMSLSGAEQQNARTNIAALGAVDVGAGYLAKSVAGGADVTLTATEAAAQIIELTGVLTGNINVKVPAAARLFIFMNSTTGAYTITVKTPSGTGIAVTQGKQFLLYCDDANVLNPGLAGVVSGPSSATDGLPPLFDGATGKLLKNSTAAGVRAALGLDTGNSPTFAGVTATTAMIAPMFLRSDLAVSINDIRTPGGIGFGVGICPSPPAGMLALSNGTFDPSSDDYGNYRYSDGSVMCWIPAFYYKWGTGANGLATNAVDIKSLSAYANEGAANAAGYALHRAFYDNGAVQEGFFVDKYLPTNNGGTASSLKNGIVLTSAQRGGIANTAFSTLTGTPANFYYGAIAAAKTRGANFFCSSRFIRAALALLSYAHAQASSATTYCAWYHATNNFPKGNNNNALGDAQDGSILYVADGNGTYAGCGKTGSANYFSRTTHNGQNSGVADLNGLVWTIEPGLTSDGTNLYVLKTSAQMKAVTAGNTLATDLWGATGIAALYDDLGTSYGAWRETGSDRAPAYGAATQVFSEATSGNAWNWAGAGGMLSTGDGGTNPFGNDIFYDYKPNEMCPISGGHWGNSSGAGVWTLNLNYVRGSSYDSVGFRAALYL